MGLTEFLLVVAVGGGIIAVLFATFRGAAGEADAESGRRSEAVAEGAARGGELADIEDRERALARSLQEIEADLEAGNLTQADYDALRSRYEGQLTRVRRRLSERASAPQPVAAQSSAAVGGRRSRLASAVGWTAGVVAFIALAALVMSQAVRPRSDEGTITGSLPGQDAEERAAAPIADVDMGRLAALEERAASAPHDVEVLVELGHLYLRLQRYPELAQVTQLALELDPNNPEALTHLGMLLFSTEHPAGVIPSFDRALEIDPDFAEALQFKGMVSFMRQDYESAVEAWERYLQVVPPEEVSPRIKAMLAAARQSLEAVNP